MTAEPVPNMPTVDLTDDMLFRIETGETVTYAELKRRLAAAPAVQLAAGREEIVLALSHINTLISYADWTVGDESPGCHPTMPSAVRQAKTAIATLTAALAHPPAQGLSLSFTLEEARANMVQADGTPCFPPRPAALSQPGPASEGDGE